MCVTNQEKENKNNFNWPSHTCGVFRKTVNRVYHWSTKNDYRFTALNILSVCVCFNWQKITPQKKTTTVCLFYDCQQQTKSTQIHLRAPPGKVQLTGRLACLVFMQAGGVVLEPPLMLAAHRLLETLACTDSRKWKGSSIKTVTKKTALTTARRT